MEYVSSPVHGGLNVSLSRSIVPLRAPYQSGRLGRLPVQISVNGLARAGVASNGNIAARFFIPSSHPTAPESSLSPSPIWLVSRLIPHPALSGFTGGGRAAPNHGKVRIQTSQNVARSNCYQFATQQGSTGRHKGARKGCSGQGTAYPSECSIAQQDRVVRGQRITNSVSSVAFPSKAAACIRCQAWR